MGGCLFSERGKRNALTQISMIAGTSNQAIIENIYRFIVEKIAEINHDDPMIQTYTRIEGGRRHII